MARAAAFAFASLAPASISASYSSSISIRFLRAGPLDAPFYNRTCTAASTHKSLNNRDLQGGPARSLTFGDKFDREIVPEEFLYRPDRAVAVPKDKRHDARPGETDLRNVKVAIHIKLDADIVEFFKARASEPDAAPYQTQINNALREAMEARASQTSD